MINSWYDDPVQPVIKTYNLEIALDEAISIYFMIHMPMTYYNVVPSSFAKLVYK